MPALVFDLGGTHLRCGVASRSTLHYKKKQRIQNFLHGLSPEEVMSRIIGQIEHYIKAVGESIDPHSAIVLAFPGPVRKWHRALDGPTLFGDVGGCVPDIYGEIHRRTAREVYLLNDVSAAAWYLSDRTTVSRFMVVTVSSGIGSKIFDRFHPSSVLDDPPFAGEIGHYVVDASPNALVCDCGGIGHLGAIASGRGIERTARRRYNNPALTNEVDIVPAIRRGEEWAVNVLTDCTEPLVRTLLAVTMGVGLERIFVIGGFAQSIGVVYQKLLSDSIAINSRYAALADKMNNIIEMCQLSEDSCLEGAAICAMRLGIAG